MSSWLVVSLSFKIKLKNGLLWLIIFKVGDQIHDNFLAEKRMEKKRKYLEQKEERLNERKEEDIKAVAVYNG